MRSFFLASFVVLALGIVWVLALFTAPLICDDACVQCQDNLKERPFRLSSYRM